MMSYEKLGFKKGQVLEAEHLNYMEEGIAAAASGGSGASLSEEEILELLMDMDVVQPLSNANNAMYVDENDKIYVL